MNDKERFLATMHFQEVDRIPLWDFGYWKETLPEWRKQGMPGDVHPDAFFKRDRQWEKVGVSLDMLPCFDEEILEADGERELMVDREGVKLVRFKESSSIPKYVEFPVKTRGDFEAINWRYNPRSPARYPLYWEERVRHWETRDYPLGIDAGSFYGQLRRWMGLENLSLAFYDDPGLVHEMLDFLADFYMETIHPALDALELDYAAFWEDMAYNKASLISPKMFQEFLIEPYKKVTSLLREHGIDIIVVDSDGRIGELVPLWLEAGVNCMFPVEARCNDPVAMRKEYGRDLLMIGGIDKLALMRDKRAVEDEVMSKVPHLISQGGYIPTVDHRVPPDVPFANYLRYLELVERIATG